MSIAKSASKPAAMANNGKAKAWFSRYGQSLRYSLTDSGIWCMKRKAALQPQIPFWPFS